MSTTIPPRPKRMTAREARLAAGFATQQAAASATGFSRSFISAVERGIPPQTLRSASRLARVYGCDIWVFTPPPGTKLPLGGKRKKGCSPAGERPSAGLDSPGSEGVAASSGRKGAAGPPGKKRRRRYRMIGGKRVLK